MRDPGMYRAESTISLSLLLFLAFLPVAGAAGYFVDKNHPQANDGNSGTEGQPFKTLQAGVNAAQPGDTIWIKAGVYEESASLNKAGTAAAPITLAAWSNDQVRLGSVLRDVPSADKWQPVASHLSWSVQLPDAQPSDMIVILDGQAITTQHTNAVPPDDAPNWATYRASDRTLTVSIGGPHPAVGHELRLARSFSGLASSSDNIGFWIIRNLEFGWLDHGIAVSGQGWAIEDCYFHDLYRFAIFPHGHVSRISRCSFYRCGNAVQTSGTGAIALIEDCLLVDSSIPWWRDPFWRAGVYYGGPTVLTGDGGWATVEFKGGGFGHVLRYNIFADNTGYGPLWYDGGETTGGRILGNSFLEDVGVLYNEYSVNDTLYLGNYLYGDSIRCRQGTRVDVVDNFFDSGGGVEWLHHDRWPLYNSYMILRGNAFVPCRYGYLALYGGGFESYMNTNSYRTSLVDYNRFRISTNCPWLMDGTQKVYGVETIRSTYGWERHGDGRPYDAGANDLTPETMGGSAVTFRMPWGRGRYWKARAMLSDRTIGGRWPGAAHMDVPAGTPPFFWRVADGNYDSRTLNSTGGWIADDYRWQPGVVQSDGAMTTNHGSQWYVDAENIYPMAGMDHGNALARRVGLSSGNRWLVVAGVDPQAMPEQGIGYWSAWLGALSGATTRVTLKLRGQNLAPAGDGGAVVWLEFLNATSRGRQRQYLVGRDEQGVVHRGALTAGSYDWTTVDETIVVPGEAVRMALFMGLKPAAGAVHFDDIDIKTDDYRAPDLLYYLPFQDLATGLVSLNVYDGNSNVVATVSPSTLWQAPGPWGIDRTIPAGKGWTTNSPAGTGWAYDLAIDPTNRPVEGPGLTLRGCTLYTNLQLSVTNEAITIAMWVLLHGYDAFSSTYQGLVNNNRRTDGANGWAFGLRDTASSTNAHTDPAQLYFTLGGGRGVRFSGTTTRVPVGAWTHVAVTWKAGAGNPAFYVNGVDAGTGSGSSDLSTKVAIPDTPPFGGSLMLSLNDAQYIPGNVIMDEVRIYQRALTPAEILVLSQTK